MPGIEGHSAHTVAPAIPLCVDLSEAVVPGSLALEQSLTRFRRSGLSFGKRTGGGSPTDGPAVTHLPYNQSLLEELRRQKDAGRTLILVADTDIATARAVAAHLGLFDDVIARGVNGAHDDATTLHERFGQRGFDFIGGTRRAAALAPHASSVRVPPAAHPRPDLATVLRALRVHQWLKNALIFLPVLAGQQFNDAGTVVRAVLAFIAFSLVASSVYVVNDLLDLPEDRLHPRKRHRPFASGRLPLSWAPYLVGGMLTTAVLISAVALPLAFAGVLAGYLVLTFAYSIKLKGAALIDVFLLAALYALRVVAGAAATGIGLSAWLLGFCMFFFLSLALVKRYAELHAQLSEDPAESRLPGRSYRSVDLPVLVALGVATGCMSVLVLALYVVGDEFARHYSRPILLWQLCPLTLYWLARAWLVVARDEMHDDPLVWAVKDQLSRWVAVAALLILILAR